MHGGCKPRPLLMEDDLYQVCCAIMAAADQACKADATSSDIRADAVPSVLDPLATLQWEKCCAMTPDNTNYSPSEMLDEDPRDKYLAGVFFNGKLYLGVSYLDDSPIQVDDHVGSLFEFSEDLKSWKRLRSLPCVLFGLSTYRSQLVLVGGIDVKTERLTKKVWVSDNGRKRWRASLPTLPKKRHSATVANTGNPEYLVVAGGSSRHVNVLVDDHWVTVGSLPAYALPINCTIYNGNLFFTIAMGYVHRIAYCKLQALVSVCSQRGEIILSAPRELWNVLATSYFAHGGKLVDVSTYSLVTLGRHLVQTCQSDDDIAIYALCAATESWVRVADCPAEFQCDNLKISVALPSGELVLIGECEDDLVVLKASVKVPPYHPDKEMDINSLYRLDAAGFQVMPLIAEKLLSHDGDTMAELTEDDEDWDMQTPQQRVNVLLEEVISGWLSRAHIKTWKALYDSMLGGVQFVGGEMEEIVLMIESYLKSPTCLKQVCSSVILSALLEQRELGPDQLQARLPDYVPTAIKRSLTHAYTIHTVPKVKY